MLMLSKAHVLEQHAFSTVCASCMVVQLNKAICCQCSKIVVLVQKIEPGALWMEVAAVVVLGGTVFAFDYFNSSDSGYYTY